MWKQFKNWNAKRRMRNAYRAYLNHLNGYDCGTEMALQFGSTQKLRARLVRMVEKMKALDPDLPDIMKGL